MQKKEREKKMLVDTSHTRALRPRSPHPPSPSRPIPATPHGLKPAGFTRYSAPHHPSSLSSGGLTVPTLCTGVALGPLPPAAGYEDECCIGIGACIDSLAPLPYSDGALVGVEK